ncbi:hypothetical protein SAMN05192575_103206 [Nocardioides alpinus]|uniref:Uncharacterized protein n=2 Tax=Nocardioides alpinus TaxID=748909 RepID=A0A1I0Y4Z4_9ACTN|nr:hypothetical protein CXG46_05330 [Nocardioides alpinus]SFB07508.1 hypothetical protein SAMN05192575_103206 [Nocardioides alpinus]
MLLALVLLSTVGVTMLLVLFVGMFAVALPVAALAVLACYVLSTRAAHDADSRTVVRETGAVALASLTGFGIWTGMLVLGFWVGIVPLLASADGYEHADEWGLLSVLVAASATVTAWWLLRRCVSPSGRAARRERRRRAGSGPRTRGRC